MKHNRRAIKLLYTISFVLISLISMQVSTQANVESPLKSLQLFDKGFNNRNHSTQPKKKKTRPKPPNTGTPNRNSKVTATANPRSRGNSERRTLVK